MADALPDAQNLLRQSIEMALEDLLSQRRSLEVGIRLVDDPTIQALNRDWRGRDKPTNVLSFPLGHQEAVPQADFPWLLGDIVMSFDTVAAESERDGKTFGDHVTHLAVHATLHLTGHDHESEDEATEMEAKEQAILARLGIADPYASGSTAGGIDL